MPDYRNRPPVDHRVKVSLPALILDALGWGVTFAIFGWSLYALAQSYSVKVLP